MITKSSMYLDYVVMVVAYVFMSKFVSKQLFLKLTMYEQLLNMSTYINIIVVGINIILFTIYKPTSSNESVVVAEFTILFFLH